MASKKFVAGSLVVHLAVGLGVFAGGVWSIERLDPDHRPLGTLAAMAPPPAVSGGGEGRSASKEATIRPKPRPTLHTLSTRTTEQPKDQAGDKDGGQGGGGPGPGGPGIGDKDGSCLVPPCGELPAPPDVELPKPPPAPTETIVTSQALSMLRIAGETQLHPTVPVQNEMRRAGATTVTGILKVCVGESGQVSRVELLRRTGYPAYDQVLVDGARQWQYKPYLTHGQPVKVCAAVTFVYHPSAN